MSDSNRNGSSKPDTGYWLYIVSVVAVGFLALIGIQQFVDRSYASRNAADYAANTKSQIAAECVIPDDYVKCVREIRQASDSSQRDEYDLYSQQTMALWTMVMGIMAVVGVALSALGVYLIWRTWIATLVAAENSSRTLQAYIARERAVLKIHDYVGTEAAWNEPRKQQFCVIVNNKGAGRAEIKNLKFAAKTDGVWPHEFADGLDQEAFIEAGDERAGIGRVTFVPPDDKCFYVLGYVEYSTVGGWDHRSHFSYMFNPREAHFSENGRFFSGSMRKFPDTPKDT